MLFGQNQFSRLNSNRSKVEYYIIGLHEEEEEEEEEEGT
jgi:hypothetical protein